MNIETLRTMLSRRPFEPIRVKTTHGDVFEVRHPEMALLAKGAMIVVHPDASGTPSDRFEVISYLHIASVETLTGATVL